MGPTPDFPANRLSATPSKLVPRGLAVPSPVIQIASSPRIGVSLLFSRQLASVFVRSAQAQIPTVGGTSRPILHRRKDNPPSRPGGDRAKWVLTPFCEVSSGVR